MYKTLKYTSAMLVNNEWIGMATFDYFDSAKNFCDEMEEDSKNEPENSRYHTQYKVIEDFNGKF